MKTIKLFYTNIRNDYKEITLKLDESIITTLDKESNIITISNKDLSKVIDIARKELNTQKKTHKMFYSYEIKEDQSA